MCLKGMHYSPEATAKARHAFEQAQRKELRVVILRLTIIAIAFSALCGVLGYGMAEMKRDHQDMPLQQTTAVVEQITTSQGGYTGERSILLQLSSPQWPPQTTYSNFYVPIKTQVQVYYRKGRSGTVYIEDVVVPK